VVGSHRSPGRARIRLLTCCALCMRMWCFVNCKAGVTGAKTGRSPRDKRVVREPSSEKDIWWAASDNAPANGSPNYEMDEK
jgi:hypothetical protein